ncbi:MAG: glycosyltransferase, partial [Phycisphaerae bacterium]
AIVALVLWPFGLAPGGWTHAAVGIMAMFGLQFIMLGILGEYVGRIFDEAKARPLYIVREKIGFEPPPAAAEEPAEADAATDQEGEEDNDFVVFT